MEKLDLTKEIKELELKNIHIWCEDNQLKFKAPKGAVTPEIKEFLINRKEDFIVFLNNNNKLLTFSEDEGARYEKFPLNDIQNSYVMGRSNTYELGGVACHGYLEVEFDEEIDPKLLERAWNKVIAKHDMLRAIVFDVGYQIIQESVPYVDVKCIDLNNGADKSEVEALRTELCDKQYELGKWPMCDLAVSLEGKKSIVYFSLDMLIADFLSMNLILNDLEKYYRDIDAPRDKAIRYRDVILYQDRLKKITSHAKREAENYWEAKLPTMGEAADIPVIKKIGIETSSFTQKKVFFEKEKWEKLCKVAKDNQVTASVLVLSALSEVVARWSGNDKFCINSTMFTRPLEVEGVNDVVGDFTDVNITSIDIDHNKTFLERVQKIQNDLWDDLEHNQISGVEVLRRLTKYKKKNVIIPVVFTSTLGLASSDDATVKRNVIYKISQTPQVYIDCQACDENGGAKVNWDVRDGVFDEALIDQMFESFKQILIDFVEDTDTLLEKKEPIELSAKSLQARNEANSFVKDYAPEMMQDGFLNSLKNYPDKIALSTEETHLSYKELSRYVQTVAEVLRANDVQPGDKIGIDIDKSHYQVAAVLATLICNGTYVPIDVRQPKARKNKITNSANIKVVLTDVDSDTYENCKSVNVKALTLSMADLDVSGQVQDFDRLAYIIFTSGTTGEPKGVCITHRAAMNTICDVNERYELGEEDVYLGLANLSFDLSVFDIFSSFKVGGMLVLPTSSKIADPGYLYDLMLLRRVSFINAVPAQIQMIVNYVESAKSIKKSSWLRTVIMSGDWIPVNLPKRIYEFFENVRVVSKGGATEASIWSIYYDVKPEETFEKSVPYGKPMANQRFLVLNESLVPCPDYVTGNLYIGGIGLSVGYLNDKEMNDAKFVSLKETGERIYRTGDRGYYRPDGNIIFMGREVGDEQVKIHGHRIELAEIRSALTECTGVDSAVTFTTGEKAEELKIAAAVTPRRKAKANEYVVDEQEQNWSNECAKECEEFIDGDLLEAWTKKSEEVVVGDIYNTFVYYKLFDELGKKATFDDVVNTIAVPEKLFKLTKRWLNILVEKEVLAEEKGNYFLIENNVELDNKKLWEEFAQAEADFEYSKEFFRYLKMSSDVLPKMIRGDENPLNILFPKGDVGPAMASYHDNKINRVQNGIAKTEIINLAKRSYERNPEKTFRILEVGAGVGGTTLDLIPELDGLNVEYHFTDLSTFFLNNAKINFKDYDFLKYGIFDINKDFSEQGYDAFSFDVILCANVLHNAKNIHRVLDNLKNMLVDGGIMTVLEETRVSYILLTSMEFKDGLTGFEDERAIEDQTFFTRTQWENNFAGAGGNIVFEFPSKQSKLDITGQTVYVVRYQSEYEQLDKKQVLKELSEKVSSYMMPSNLLVLSELPLTANKKVDTKKVKSLLEVVESTGDDAFATKEMPETELEKKVATVWARELKISDVGRNDNFYDIGGDSLLIAQVVGKMVEDIEEAKDWEWSSLLTEMMQHPTVKEISIQIEKFLSSRDEFVDPSLIKIKESNKENAQSVAKVLFHAGTGTLSAYTEFMTLLEQDSKDNEAVLGFSFGNEAEYISINTPDTFKVLGKKYGEILRKLGYKNYVLIGHCVGGLIALESAQYLKDNGLNVSDVTLISATIQKNKAQTAFGGLNDEIYYKALRTSLDNELLLERTFAKLINANELKAGYTITEEKMQEVIQYIVKELDANVSADTLCALDGDYKDVGDEFRRLASKPLSERLNNLYSAIERSDSELMEHERKLLNTLFNIFSQNFGCVAFHVPREYTGFVRIFSCEIQGASFYQEFFGEDYETWKQYIKGEHTFELIKGQHFDCIVGENLNKNIDRILDFKLED